MLELEVLDVDPLGAERLEDAGKDARSVGDVHAQPVEGAGVVVRRSSIRRRLPLASPIQRARKPASPAASADSSCSTRRRCSASAAREGVAILEEDVDPDPRVRAGDARHVAQRPAGGGERLVAFDAVAPAWLTRTFASACGRWLVTRNEPVVRGGIDRDGRAPSDAANACTTR